MFEEMLSLILIEQEKQSGKFIEVSDIELYLQKLKDKAEFFVSFVNGEFAGFIAYYANDPLKNTAFITLVLTNKKYRGRRISSGLLDGVIGLLKERNFKCCALEVKKNNEVAISLYKKKGFFTYKESETSIFMEKIISRDNKLVS